MEWIKNNILLAVLIGLLLFDIFKAEDNSKLENLIIKNNQKIDSLNLEVKIYEYKTDESKKKIDSINVIIGELPNF